MSWDVVEHKIVCPCGKGYIIQEVRSDDWGRCESGKPYIACDECKKKYKIASISYFTMPWKGDGIAYYLVPIDLKDDAVYEDKYSKIAPYEFAGTNFPKYMICSYSIDNLKGALQELQEITSCSAAKGTLQRIVKERKRYLGSCKREDLLADIEVAIEKYNNGDNYKLIAEEKERNYAKRKAFEDRIKAVGKTIF